MRRSIVLHRVFRYPVWALSLLATAPACGRIGFEVLASADAGDSSNADEPTPPQTSHGDASNPSPATDDAGSNATLDDGSSSVDGDNASAPDPASDAGEPNVGTNDDGVPDDGMTGDGSTAPSDATQTTDTGSAQTDASSAPLASDDTPPSASVDAGSTARPPTTAVDASAPPSPSDLDSGSVPNILDGGSANPTDPTSGTGMAPSDAGESDASTDASVEGGVQPADAAPPIAVDAGGCTPSNTGFESCDGIDNDCDTLTDEDGCPTTCHGAATADNGYMVCDELVGYDVAAAACEAQGLLLVTIDSAELNQALNELMYPADGSMDQLYVWIGASRVDSSSAWTWADGATWGTYANWKNGVPGNAGTANCIQVDDLARWLAGQCTQTKRYACELYPP